MIQDRETQKGTALFKAGRLDDAQAIFKSALAREPENHEILNNLGVVHYTRGDLATAENCLLKSLLLKNDSLDTLRNIARLYGHVSWWRESARYLEMYILIDDQNADILNQLAITYLEMGRVEEAFVVLATSIGIDPRQQLVRDSVAELERLGVVQKEIPPERGFEMMKKRLTFLYGYEDNRFGAMEKDRLYRRLYYRNQNLALYKKAFSVVNPGRNTALITLYTPNIRNYAIQAERNFTHYANKHLYTLYVYRDTIDLENGSIGAFQKSIALLKHIRNHAYIIWLDSDMLVVNMDRTFESIIEKQSDKDLLACKDPFFYLNSGALIFKNTEYSIRLLEEWYRTNFHEDTDLSSLKDQADQPHLINLLIEKDENSDHHFVFSSTEFNVHPKDYRGGDFILHFMGYSEFLRAQSMYEINRTLLNQCN